METQYYFVARPHDAAHLPEPPTRDHGRDGVRVNCVAPGPERASE